MLLLRGLKTRIFNELLQASGVLFLASVLANICNLLFWLFMARRLSAVDYGVLNALFSLLMILSLPATTIQTVAAKAVSQVFSARGFAEIKCFLLHFGKRVLAFALLFLLFFTLASPAISGFLKIASPGLALLTGFVLFFSVISPLTIGVLQGSQKFLSLSLNTILSALLKLVLAAALVLAGLKVKGALLGLGLAVLLTLGISFLQLPRQLWAARGNCWGSLKMEAIYGYTVGVFFSLLGWMVLTNVDVIMVKHFFSPEEAGWYSLAQMVGKVILFLPAVIGVVMFPKMSQAYSQKISARPLLLEGLWLTGSLCVIAGVFCSLFPAMVLKILTGSRIAVSVRLVPFFCIAMTLFALVNLFMYYNLALHRFRYTVYLLLAGLLQIGLIALFHSRLSAVLYTLMGVSAGLFCSGLIELRKEARS